MYYTCLSSFSSPPQHLFLWQKKLSPFFIHFCQQEFQCQCVCQSLETVIELRVKDGVRAKTYTYQQLRDLQSKLMLVVGKAEASKRHVDTFVEVLGVTSAASLSPLLRVL